jgi:hypothetical protein
LPTTLELRQGVDGITARASTELAPVWSAGLALYDLRALLNELLPGLIDEYGLAASAYAADWYDDYRTEQDVPGRFTAKPQPVREPGVEQLVAWATKPLEQDVPNLMAACSFGCRTSPARRSPSRPTPTLRPVAGSE